MDTADPSEPEDALAALLHRLASPLGAIANYAYLLPAEAAQESRDGILAAMASVRTSLLDAQRWLDALATTRDIIPDGGVDLCQELRSAAERHGLAIRTPKTALPRVALPYAAATRLADAVLRDAATGGATELRVELAAGEGVQLALTAAGRLWSEAQAAQALDLFSARDSGSNDAHGELALAASLARRLGGRAWGAVGSAGEAVLHLVLPAHPAQNRNA